MESPLSSFRMQWDHEPARVGLLGDEVTTTIANRGSISPQRGEGQG